MSNLVIVSGDFSSGSTLLFTLFRRSGGYYSLYEPLHQKLPEYLLFPMQGYEHHFYVGDYFKEYKGFSELRRLFDPAWGIRKYLHLTVEDDADDLHRYLSYLIGTAFGRAPRVMLKENRFTFRLAWLRSRFPNAKIVHIQREKDSQWQSWIKRAQAFKGCEDVGQSLPTYNGFNLHDWCEELTPVYPELDVHHFSSGYERFSTFWELSRAEHLKYADISINYRDFLQNFASTMSALGECIGFTFDGTDLEQFVVQPDRQQPLRPKGSDVRSRLAQLVDRAGRRYAMSRVAAERARLHQRTLHDSQTSALAREA